MSVRKLDAKSTRNAKRSKVSKLKVLEEEKQLESLLFGDVEEVDEVKEMETRETQAKPAWVDPDDETVEVDLNAADRLKKLQCMRMIVNVGLVVDGLEKNVVTGTEYTAKLRMQHSILHPNAEIKENSMTQMPSFSSRQLAVHRLSDVYLGSKSKGVSSISFCASSPLLAVCRDTFQLYAVDGEKNPSVFNMKLEFTPTEAAWIGKSKNLLLCGRRKNIYHLELETNTLTNIPFPMKIADGSIVNKVVATESAVACIGNGVVSILSSSLMPVSTLYISGGISDIAICENNLIATGPDASVYIYDVRTWKPICKHVDEGAVYSTKVALGKSVYATGNDSGSVNLYQAPATSNNKPHTFFNLVTSISHLRFSSDESILACASSNKKDALRIVHVPSKTVYSNWPTGQTPLSFVKCVDFSPNSGYFAIGNDKGKVLMYRFGDFNSY